MSREPSAGSESRAQPLSPSDIARANAPDAVAKQVTESLERIEEACDGLPWPESEQPLWFTALAVSDFLRETAERHSAMVAELCARQALQQAPRKEDWLEDWRREQDSITDENTLMLGLRRFRRRFMFRIIWRDMLGLAPLEETLSSMTHLAETCIQLALDWLYDDSSRQWGIPMGRHSDEPQRLVVIAMGKLGAGELNVSSDIDLMFAFPENGETRGGARSIDNQQFFIRLGQRLVQVLDKPTADGFVFRTDMRLRPYGNSGALALSFAAMEAYYQDQGREWERYAMIKSRVVAGDRIAGERLMTSLRPFVYRRYIDFSAFESLREMKSMISREVRRKGLEDNIKLGGGGIREVEFIVQAFQLIRGGRDRDLQARELLVVLEALGRHRLLPEPVIQSLANAYCFLRRAEHALQGIADRQTQTLPGEPVDRWRVATVMGFQSWPAFIAALDVHRQEVSRHFADIIASEAEEEASAAIDETWSELWNGELDEEAAISWLGDHGFEAPEQSYRQLRTLHQGRPVQTLQNLGRQRLDQFMPVLLHSLVSVEHPSLTLERVMLLVEAVLRRSAYLVLLNENPAALDQLVRLCSASPWIAEQLADTPLLLDELLNSESLYTPPPLTELQDDLRQQLLRIPEDDLEAQMECLRHFKKAHVLRVAASEVRGTLPLMKVSDYLTWIAEVVLSHVVVLAWRGLVERHGYPEAGDETEGDMDFAVIGYGKLGGIELGYTSDLDLVFIHSAEPMGSTNGEKPVDNAVFFTRLGQRIVHILSTHTPSGQLYEVDMRLRPSGNSGLLVSGFDAFERYQQEGAWTWEHQALVRARWVGGSSRVGERFEALRRRILTARRDRGGLRDEVVQMREKMRQALATQATPGEAPTTFQLKQDRGGIIDIEFMVQYLILAYACDHPELTRYSDNIRQLETLSECGILESDVVERLIEIYIAMRSTVHRRALQKQNSRVEAGQFVEERRYVADLWHRLMVGGAP